MEIIKEIQNNEDNAFVVKNYPYGFKKTLKKFWIETTKRGDRLCGMTLNPKTNKWNKPKKTTYCDVMVLVKMDNGHIKTSSWGIAYTSLEDLDKFLSFIGDYPLNDFQKNKIEMGKKVYKIREGITYEIKARRFKHIVNGEITESVPIMEMKNYKEVNDKGDFIE